jgi:beta-glucosidase
VRACIRADTTFGYSNLKLNASSIGPCDTFAATVDVTNTGQVLSDEVVQLYVQSAAAGSVPSPRVRLADFERVRELAPGAKATVHLTITPQYLSVVKEGGKDNFWCVRSHVCLTFSSVREIQIMRAISVCI